MLNFSAIAVGYALYTISNVLIRKIACDLIILLLCLPIDGKILLALIDNSFCGNIYA